MTKVTESARRLYGELVRGRSRVRVVEQPNGEVGTTPRFLLSPYRSGTTLFRYCLDSHPALAVPPETDFLLPLSMVLDDAPSMTGLADLGYDHDAVNRRLGRFGRQFLDAYALGKGADQGWLDKSPRYAESPDFLPAFFPDAKFVVMHRHPLDQVHSFTKGGTFSHPALGDAREGKQLVLRAADYWREVTDGLIRFTRSRSGVLATTYENLCGDPRSTLGAVLDHFELPWDDEVLEYHKHDHDLGREAGRVTGTRGFSIATGKWSQWPPGWAQEAWHRVVDSASMLGYEFSA